MAVPSPKKTLKDLPKKKMKPKRRPERKLGAVTKSLRPQERPDIVDLSPPEEADQLLTKKGDGGSLRMVEKNGKKVPFYAADGVGKMAMGGKCRGMGAAGRGGAFTRNG